MANINDKIRRGHYDLRREIEEGLEYMAAHEEVESVIVKKQLVGHQRNQEHLDVRKVSYRGRVMSVYFYAKVITKDSRLRRGVGCVVNVLYKGGKAVADKLIEKFRAHKLSDGDENSEHLPAPA